MTTHWRDTDPDRCPLIGKVRHRHRSAAMRAMRQQLAHLRHKGTKERAKLHVYLCACGGWHVANTTVEARKVVYKREK